MDIVRRKLTLDTISLRLLSRARWRVLGICTKGEHSWDDNWPCCEPRCMNTVFPRIMAVPRLIASLEQSPPLDRNIWNNRLPRIIAPPPPPTPLTIFSSFYPLPVKLKCSLIQQNWSVTIQALTPRILTLKISQGTKFGTLKRPKFSLFDVTIFWFNGIMKQNIKGTTSSEQYLK